MFFIRSYFFSDMQTRKVDLPDEWWWRFISFLQTWPWGGKTSLTQRSESEPFSVISLVGTTKKIMTAEGRFFPREKVKHTYWSLNILNVSWTCISMETKDWVNTEKDKAGDEYLNQLDTGVYHRTGCDNDVMSSSSIIAARRQCSEGKPQFTPSKQDT